MESQIAEEKDTVYQLAASDGKTAFSGSTKLNFLALVNDTDDDKKAVKIEGVLNEEELLAWLRTVTSVQ